MPDLSLAGNIAWHDARFTHFALGAEGQGGASGEEIHAPQDEPVDLSGNQLTLAPHILASAGLLYTPPQGFHPPLS
jgi:hypothetical protein